MGDRARCARRSARDGVGGPRRRHRLRPGGVLSIRAPKALALGTPALAHGVEVIPVLNLVLVRNHGVSFGMLGGVVPWWGLILLSLAIVAALVVWLWRSETRQASVALGLIIGGALATSSTARAFKPSPIFWIFIWPATTGPPSILPTWRSSAAWRC